MAKRQQARHRELYHLKCKGAELEVGDLVLVKQTAWKGRHKIQGRWESEEYLVAGQPTPGVSVYTVKGVVGARTRVLHRNLWLPLQGRVKQQGGIKGEIIWSSEDEEEDREEMPKVDRAPQGRPRRTTQPKASPTQQKEASVVKDAFADLKSGTPNSRLLSKQKNSLIATPSSLSQCQGMRIVVRRRCTQTPWHLTPQLVIPPLLTY